MSGFSAWSYTAKVTIWSPSAVDAYGQPTGYDRSVLNCSYVSGRKLLVDNAAEQFMPKTMIYCTEPSSNVPDNGDYVLIGEHTDLTPPANAEVIRLVSKFDPSTFNEGSADLELATG